MSKRKELIKVALGAVTVIVLFSLVFLVMNHLGFLVVANEEVELPITDESITVPEVLTYDEYEHDISSVTQEEIIISNATLATGDNVTLVRAPSNLDEYIDDDYEYHMLMEEAANLGALYIYDIFEERIDEMTIIMIYQPRTQPGGVAWWGGSAQWRGMVRPLLDEELLLELIQNPHEMERMFNEDPDTFFDMMDSIWGDLQFTFFIDAITGERITLNGPDIYNLPQLTDEITFDEFLEAEGQGRLGVIGFDNENDMWSIYVDIGDTGPFVYTISEEEMDVYLQLAREYAQRHFVLTDVDEVVFEYAWAVMFDRDEAGVIIPTGFVLRFNAGDEMRQFIGIDILSSTQSLLRIMRWEWG